MQAGGHEIKSRIHKKNVPPRLQMHSCATQQREERKCEGTDADGVSTSEDKYLRIFLKPRKTKAERERRSFIFDVF